MRTSPPGRHASTIRSNSASASRYRRGWADFDNTASKLCGGNSDRSNVSNELPTKPALARFSVVSRSARTSVLGIGDPAASTRRDNRNRSVTAAHIQNIAPLDGRNVLQQQRGADVQRFSGKQSRPGRESIAAGGYRISACNRRTVGRLRDRAPRTRASNSTTPCPADGRPRQTTPRRTCRDAAPVSGRGPAGAIARRRQPLRRHRKIVSDLHIWRDLPP